MTDENQPTTGNEPDADTGAQVVDDDALEFATGGTGLCISSTGECAPPATNTTYSYGSTASVVKPVNTTLT